MKQNKVIYKEKLDQGLVHVRKDKFDEIKNLWEKINRKYYLTLDYISEVELVDKSFFNRNSLANFIREFQICFLKSLIQ